MSTREELTRLAEKCVRQGRVDEALSHYQAVADMPPVDWGIVKQLADLLERTGQREGAAAQFCRWADHLFAEGFHSKAAALYKKVLKLESAHEHALWQLAEVSVALKLRADARVAFARLEHGRRQVVARQDDRRAEREVSHDRDREVIGHREEPQDPIRRADLERLVGGVDALVNRLV